MQKLLTQSICVEQNVKVGQDKQTALVMRRRCHHVRLYHLDQAIRLNNFEIIIA